MDSPHPIKTSENRPGEVVIRGHTLLCLQGFRGEGYSENFIRNMAEIHDRLKSDPKTRVLVTDSPDHFCGACPHLKSGCTLRGPNFEQHIVAQDRQVLDLLGLKAGQAVTWEEILFRIGSRIRSKMLDDICGDCQWLTLGFCKEGIDQLHQSPGSDRQVSEDAAQDSMGHRLPR